MFADKLRKRFFPLFSPEPQGGGAGGIEGDAIGENDSGFAGPDSSEGENDPEFADPDTQAGANEEESGESAGAKESAFQTPQERAAFAAMRREKERLEQELMETSGVLSALYPDAEDPVVAALSQLHGMTPGEVERIRREKAEAQAREIELDRLWDIVATTTFEKDLNDVKQAYPEVKAKTIDDLGSEFMNIMATGQVDAVTAYAIVKAREEQNKRTPPPDPGKVGTKSAPEKGFYTVGDVRAMSPEEVSRNWNKIQKSRNSWK